MLRREGPVLAQSRTTPHYSQSCVWNGAAWLPCLLTVARLSAMPKPHPLRSLHAAGELYAAEAVARLRSLLATHGTVRATAAALLPPVHETTLADWMTEWGMRDVEVTKKKAPPRKKGLAKSSDDS